MTKSRKISLLLFGSTLFICISCSSTRVPVNQGGFVYSGIYFGKNFNPDYKQGIVDGCITAKGKYKKSHRLFNINNDYNKGWFLGRKRCRNLLKIDENGDLVL